MQNKFVVQQRKLGISECERLCSRGSRDVLELARQAGWSNLPGTAISIPVGISLDMLVLSSAMNHGVELRSTALPLMGLRTEALLKLGEDLATWSFEGTAVAEREFWSMLYGVSDAVRPRIAPLLGISAGAVIREIRFFSQGNIERLSPAQFEQGSSSGTPRFSIDAHDLAARFQTVCGNPIFYVKEATSG